MRANTHSQTYAKEDYNKIKTQIQSEYFIVVYMHVRYYDHTWRIFLEEIYYDRYIWQMPGDSHTEVEDRFE